MLIDRYLNHVLTLVLFCNLLRERSIEEFFATHHIIAATTAQSLSVVAGNLAFIEFLGFVMLWSGSPPQMTRRHHRYHRLLGIVLVPAFLAGAYRIRPAEGVWEVHGWDVVLTLLLFQIIPSPVVFQTLRLGLREFVRPNVARRELVVASCFIGVSLAILGSGLGGLWNMMVFHGQLPAASSGYFTFELSLVLFTHAAVPIVRALIARAGLDGTTRRWRDLQELQKALATAAPESVSVVTPSSPRRRQKTVLELHQSVIQIRDGMLALRPYSREIADEEAAGFLRRYAVPVGQRDAAVQAWGIAEAIRAREGGNKPNSGGVTFGKSSTADLEQEVAELVRVSKWWPSTQIEPTALAPTHERIR